MTGGGCSAVVIKRFTDCTNEPSSDGCVGKKQELPQPTFHTVHTPHALPSRVCGGCSSKVNGGGSGRRGSIWRDRPTFYDFAGAAAFIPLHLTPSQAQTTPPPPPAGRLNPHQIQLPPPTIRISQSSSAYVSFSCESEFPVPQDLTH